MQVAVALHNQGELDKAEFIYREILAVDPNNFYALRFLGCLCRLKEEYFEGVELLKQAASLRPEDKDVFLNLGNILADAGRHAEALTALRRCIALFP